MPITDSDLDQCFSTADFAIEARFSSPARPEYIIETRGYFSEGSDAVKMLDSHIEAIEPNLICRASDVKQIARGWEAFIAGSFYRVERIERLGTGVATVYLTRVKSD